ncbi:MAG: SDR family oxidoreductase, partial [Anaerolineales bacterium]|nr:SDR family oxidoreductase [Anaerolineales bacterium]
MKLALVTGGAGFIGSHLVEGLLARDYKVRVLDNFTTGKRENLADVLTQIELIEGSVTNLTTAHAAMRNVDVVFHQAALPSVPRSVKNPLESNEINITGTLNILVAARDAGVKRVVYAASSSAYGDQPALPKVETMTPDPMSPYAIAKLAGEMYARAFTQLYGLSTVSLRYFNVFGPRQDPATQYAGVLAKFCTCAVTGQPYPVHGDGEQSRDFTYVENVVQANIRAAESEIEGAPVINVACGERTTLNELIRLLNQLTEQKLPAHYGPERAGDVRHSHADITRAGKLLGYEPMINLREGLKRTLE